MRKIINNSILIIVCLIFYVFISNDLISYKDTLEKLPVNLVLDIAYMGMILVTFLIALIKLIAYLMDLSIFKKHKEISTKEIEVNLEEKIKLCEESLGQKFVLDLIEKLKSRKDSIGDRMCESFDEDFVDECHSRISSIDDNIIFLNGLKYANLSKDEVINILEKQGIKII